MSTTKKSGAEQRLTASEWSDVRNRLMTLSEKIEASKSAEVGAAHQLRLG